LIRVRPFKSVVTLALIGLVGVPRVDGEEKSAYRRYAQPEELQALLCAACESVSLPKT
jgi:hypothetical protein